MSKIGIFFGSDTGNTENIANKIYNNFNKKNTQIFDIANAKKKDIEYFDVLLFGIPTWYYGELQYDWDDFIPILKTISFKNKKVGLFGCGDQEDYSEYFCDALRIIYDIIKKNQGVIIGYWPNNGYYFHKTKSLKNQDYFVGLAIDEDRQPQLTNIRIQQWIQKIKQELN